MNTVTLVLHFCALVNGTPVDCAGVHLKKPSMEACAAQAKEINQRAPVRISDADLNKVYLAHCERPRQEQTASLRAFLKEAAK